MATVAKNAVGQYASFTGTSVVTLAGAALEGARTFAAYADGTSGIPVMLQEMDGDGARGLPIAWEYCQCTYNATAGTLTRGAIYASSNSGAPVNFSAGLKRAFVSLPAAPSAGDPRGAFLAASALHAWPLDEVTGSRLDRKNSAHLLEVGGAVGSETISGRRVLSTSGGAAYLSATNAGGLLVGSPNKFGIPESGRTYCCWIKQVSSSMPVVFLPYPNTLRVYVSGEVDMYPHGIAMAAAPLQAWLFICVSLGSSDRIAWSAYGIPTVVSSISATSATEVHVGNSPVFGSPPLQMRDLFIFDIGPDKFRQEHYDFLFNFGAGRQWSELV